MKSCLRILGINGDIGNSVKEATYYLMEKGLEKGLDKVMPGSSGPKAKEIINFFIDMFSGKTTKGNVLGNDFNLGKAIVIQGAQLKAKIAEQTIDKATDRDKK